MVSFSCEVCSDTLKKPKLDSHAARCHGAYYTCIDCSKTFIQGQWKDHTSCISEAEKYQGSFYKPGKGKGKGGKGREDGATAANATVTATLPTVKKVRIAIPEVTDAEIKRPKKDKKDKDKKDKKRKGSLEGIATPVTEVNEVEAKDIPMADAPLTESPEQPKSSKKEGKEKKGKGEKRDKKGKDKKDKKDKKHKKKSKDTPATLENNTDFTPAPEAVDNKKRKSLPAEDTPAKKKKGEEEKARVSQERLAELVGEEELGLAGFLERLEKDVEGASDSVSKEVFQGLRVRVDGGKVVLSFEG